MIRKIAKLLTLTILLCGCNSHQTEESKKTIYVTIAPLRSIVQEIVSDDYDVKVLVPNGASPETFEPTVKQLMELNDAEFVYTTGLINFERTLTSSVKHSERVIDLSHGIELMEGCCSHGHHHHSHGVDPHIWTSFRTLRTMVENITSTLHPDSTKYHIASKELIDNLNLSDKECSEKISSCGVDAIMIYHPALTYYARDYNLEQIAIEHDGKEPSPRQLTALVDKAKQHNIKEILIQPQYNKEKLQSLATECGTEIVEIDPLSEDIITEIKRVTDIICHKDE